jgi:hypothetical protein
MHPGYSHSVSLYKLATDLSLGAIRLEEKRGTKRVWDETTEDDVWDEELGHWDKMPRTPVMSESPELEIPICPGCEEYRTEIYSLKRQLADAEDLIQQLMSQN